MVAGHMSLKLGKHLIERLKKNPGTFYTAREIATWIFEIYPQECAAKKANSTNNRLQTDNELLLQIAAEIGSQIPRLQKNNPYLKSTEGRPRRYYWSEQNAEQEVTEVEKRGINVLPSSDNPTTNNNSTHHRLTEQQLYPLLSQYLFQTLSIYSMRIDEKRSSNKAGNGGNEWLHPDLVGMEDLTKNWTREIKECVGVLTERRAQLWSFEVKLLINRSNVRKSYFQTVSNSSWAHFGYLVAAVIEGEDTLKELNLLAAAHGIGVIELNTASPTDSQILIPAREHAELNWDTCNRLAEENTDFINFLARVRRFYQTGEVIFSEWGIKR